MLFPESTRNSKLSLALRRPRGQSLMFMGLIIGFFVLGSIGLFGFEVNRLLLARQHLQAACDAAALAGAATLASSDQLNTAQAHDQAINTALNSFRANKIIGVDLNAATLTASVSDTPLANQALLFVEFLDPNNNNTPVSVGDPAGKIVRVSAMFGAQPNFGQFLGLQSVPLRYTSSGGVPDLDVVLCFDVSGSIDDQTPVTFVKRYWNSGTSKNVYSICSTKSGSPAGSTANGLLYDILGPPATGSRTNAMPPQYLGISNQSDHRWGLTFSEDSSSYKGLRGTNTGAPPGNYSNPSLPTSSTTTYTDLVVNIDGKTVFGGLTTPAGYAFPNVATLVEAARGNLETNAVFTASKANTTLPSSVIPKTGYQAEYLSYAAKNLHPLYDAQVASQEFFTIMNTNTSGHFSIVAFSDSAGSKSYSSYTAYNVDSTYTGGGQKSYPIPFVALNKTTGVTNYSNCYNALPTTVATTGTNIGDAVSQAVTQLTTNSRPASKKAIVLFTDGQPTVGGALSSDPWTNARQAAVQAKNAGIPIYAIGLAQNPEIIPNETAILNDTNSSTTNGGMAGIAGNGGKFFLVTDVNNLRLTFENIARQLVALVK